MIKRVLLFLRDGGIFWLALIPSAVAAVNLFAEHWAISYHMMFHDDNNAAFAAMVGSLMYATLLLACVAQLFLGGLVSAYLTKKGYL